MSDAQSDIGPTAPARWRVYAQARELQALAALAVELSADTRGCDLPRALGTLDRMRAILGEAR